MRKRLVILLVIVVALGAGSVAAFAASAAAPTPAKQVFSWRMQTHHPPNSTIGESSDMFAKDVDRLSGGRLKITKMDAGTLMPNADIFKGVRAGMVEVGWSDPAYHVGFMPEAAIGTAPFMFQNIMDTNVLGMMFAWNSSMFSTISLLPATTVLIDGIHTYVSVPSSPTPHMSYAHR